MSSSANLRRRMLRSEKAAIQFPVSRIAHFLKRGRYCRRLGATAPVYLAAVLENLVAEVLELAANMTERHKRKVIKPRHILLAVRQEVEVNKLFHGVTISQSGVIPKIRKELERGKARSTKRAN
uniref:Histone H2A n=1 Tax=Lilium davidii var. unicolor TaxID=1473204 RepID=A0A0U5G6Q3_LILDA|nr:gH2A.2 [Lilium davidii var. unicolor]